MTKRATWEEIWGGLLMCVLGGVILLQLWAYTARRYQVSPNPDPDATPVNCDPLMGTCYDPSDVPQCPDPKGDAKVEEAQTLNLYKNNIRVPLPRDIKQVTLKDLMAPGDDTSRFRNGQAAQITAYVVGVKVGGIETANCHHKEPGFRDTHIELAVSGDQTTPEIDRVIVEVTPHTRYMVGILGGGKETYDLARLLIGKRVRVTGWMLFDSEHVGESENTNPGGKKNWRATAWEPAHPVTGLEIVPEIVTH